jgi:hypothetical protein
VVLSEINQTNQTKIMNYKHIPEDQADPNLLYVVCADGVYFLSDPCEYEECKEIINDQKKSGAGIYAKFEILPEDVCFACELKLPTK